MRIQHILRSADLQDEHEFVNLICRRNRRISGCVDSASIAERHREWACSLLNVCNKAGYAQATISQLRVAQIYVSEVNHALPVCVGFRVLRLRWMVHRAVGTAEGGWQGGVQATSLRGYSEISHLKYGAFIPDLNVMLSN